MLIQADNETVLSGGLGQGNAFTIAASAKAFDILSSNLYQNKILAVIREISCNAADAHKMVGRPLSDIKVHLPIFSEPYFSVRDYGPGLSRENVLHLYTTYFQSTKDGNNDLIGGFGLGSKSPFAIADQFTVTSWHGGTKTMYVCYKQNGVPAINVISSEPSSEPAGLEVRVASNERATTWQTEAATYFQWWPEQPQTNFALGVDPINHADNVVAASSTLNADGQPTWYLARNLSAPKVFMGLVAYDLNLSAIPNLPEEVNSALSNLGIVFVLNVGDVSINPSRETLSYDPKTCALLTARLKELYAQFTKDISAALDQQPTLYDARKFLFSDTTLSTTRGSLQASIQRLLDRGRITLSWRGQPVRARVTFDSTHIPVAPPATAVSFTRYNKNTYSSRWHNSNLGGSSFDHHVNGYETTFFWTPSITSKTYATLKHYAATTLGASGRSYSADFLIVSGGTYQEVSDAFLKLGLPPVTDVTTLPAPPRAAPGSRTSSSTARAYVANDNGFDRSETMIDLKGGGYYCAFFDGRPRGIRHYDFTNMRTLGLLPADTRLVGFQERRLESKRFLAALANAGWQQFDQQAILDNLPIAMVENHHYAVRLHARGLHGDISLLAMFEQPAMKFTDPALATLQQEWLARPIFKNAWLATNTSFNFTCPLREAAVTAGYNRAADFFTRLVSALDSKPLLRYLPSAAYNQNDQPKFVRAVLDYANS